MLNVVKHLAIICLKLLSMNSVAIIYCSKIFVSISFRDFYWFSIKSISPKFNLEVNNVGWISFIITLCIFCIGSIVGCVYGETALPANSNIKGALVSDDTKEDEEEIRIGKDEFDEIVCQLQGMKELLQRMKWDYDARLKEMQEKIAFLEREKSELESGQTLKEKKPANVTIEKDTHKVSTVNKDEKVVVLQTGEITNSPSSQQISKDETSTSLNSNYKETTITGQLSDSQAEKWSPAQPLTVWSMGKNYMNISFDGLFSAGGSTAQDLGKLETGGHDPNQRGFTVQNLETVFEGAIDPYFKGQSNIVFQIDKDGESFLEVEEAYLTSMSLPLNLQVKAGTFFTEFGRLNQFHPHAWDFADQPLINGRFLSPDGLRNPGARLSWLAPSSNYTELFFTVQDSQGETVRSFRNKEGLFGREAVDTGVRNMGDMLYVPRIATSFDLTDEQTILLGASAAMGPNSTGTDEDTLIYGLDLFWKWKSRYASGGFPFIGWQTEVMSRRFEAGADNINNLQDEVMNNWGTYSQITWGFKKRWVAGLRGDYVDGEEGAIDPLGFERWRLSPNLTFFPSEFSKIRLQYNYDDILEDNGTEHSVFLQFEFLLGSHGAHKF